MAQMMANIAFWNSVMNLFFAAVEGIQAELQRRALSKAQWELLHSVEARRRSLQGGYYLRPVRRGVDAGLFCDHAVGVVVVDLLTGTRSDLFFGALTSTAR